MITIIQALIALVVMLPIAWFLSFGITKIGEKKMKRKQLESMVEELTNRVEILEHFKGSTLDWVTDLSSYLEIRHTDLKKYTISQMSGKPKPEDPLTLQEKKLEQEIKWLKIRNEKELGKWIDREKTQTFFDYFSNELMNNLVHIPKRMEKTLNQEQTEELSGHLEGFLNSMTKSVENFIKD